MKKILLGALSALVLTSGISETAFARKSVRDIIRPQVILDNIARRLGEKTMTQGALAQIKGQKAAQINLETARAIVQEGVALPLTQLSGLLSQTRSNKALREATTSEGKVTLIESIELSIAIREAVRNGTLEREGLERTEIELLDRAAENALHAVGALASVPASQLIAFENNPALHAMIRQISQIEPLLKDYTPAERESWNRQLQAYKDNLATLNPLEAYKDSIREVVANEKGVTKEQVTETMLREKLEEIRRCKA